MWQNILLFRVEWAKIALKIEPLINLNFHKQTNKKFLKKNLNSWVFFKSPVKNIRVNLKNVNRWFHIESAMS